MLAVKLLLVFGILSPMSVSVSAGLLDNIFPTIMQEFYKFAPFEEGYRFSVEDPDGNGKREEMGVILNPGTPEQELVVMGTYSVYDEKTDTETVTMYTADKEGYKPRYMIKNRKLSANALKSAAG
uniref:Larval cuticle protein 5 n=1 Tax=Glossina morsitans morsitans TaxID=37546 RepID=A0A1B0FJ04_GLOMM